MAVLRRAVADDIDSMLGLLETLFNLEQDFAPSRAKQHSGLELLLKADNAYAVVAEHAGEVVAMATLQVMISTAEGGPVGLIEDVVVAAPHRGRGIGRALMNHLTQWAAKEGLLRLQLLADRDNRPALTFYRKQGWSRTSLIALRKTALD
jgi:GNAT superfamily N-acetyltransferase